MYTIGVDLGGTNIAIGIVNDRYEIVRKGSVPTKPERGADPIIADMIVIYAALPTASLLPAYALQYDPDPENQFTAAGTCVISTLFSTVSIPLWHLLLQAL